MFKKKRSQSEQGHRFNDSFNQHADKFYKLYRLNAVSKPFLTVLALGVGAYSIYNVYDQYQEDEGKRPHIAVISLSGAMGSGTETGDGTIIARAIHKAYINPQVKAVLIEAESGGGGPSDAINIYKELRNLRQPEDLIQILPTKGLEHPASLDNSSTTTSDTNLDFQRTKSNVLSILKDGRGSFVESDRKNYKPVIVSVKTMCASACYYAASAADAIYADQNAIIGSIGVRMDHWDISELMKNVGVKNTPLTAGSYKDALDPWHPISDTAREFMQAELLGKMHEMFIQDVEAGRGGKILPRDEADKAELYSGKFWLTPTAIKYGLVDGSVTSTEIRERLSKLYGTDRFKTYNEPHKSLRSALGLATNALDGLTNLSRFVDTVTGDSKDSITAK